ncbi:MAG: DUF1415 domain-containing protein [Methylococcales bacterium]|nr:DUF1415 domain-containing protein [Methylococcaceae bacterium]
MSTQKTLPPEIYIETTRRWLESVIVTYNICPFAKRELDKGSVELTVDLNTDIEQCLLNLMLECEKLDKHPEIETSLLIYGSAFSEFDDYLDFVELAETLTIDQGYEGIYQLASFHPNYCFEGSPQDDPANYTNRAPYPMLHLLREDSLEKALAHYPDPENIPERNIALTRELGLAKMKSLLASCYAKH